ncbi:MAG TPA: hypothetical protein VNA04_16640 [Thermoanaerobaculia bacterium]|nr:hypothetical protein [Thermoanaerobaculia bacterium]
MATATYEEADDRGKKTARRAGGSRGTTARRGTGSALNTAALLDIVERLGVVDLVIARLRQRLEEVDIDELLDEAGEHLKRNPEVLVASLGAITIAAGALVYLNKLSGGVKGRGTSKGSSSTKRRSRKSSR